MTMPTTAFMTVLVIMPTTAFVIMIVMMFTTALMVMIVVMPIATIATATTAVVLMCHFFQFFWANLFNTFHLPRKM